LQPYSFAQVATMVAGAVQAAPPDDMAGALSPSVQYAAIIVSPASQAALG
jgi:hypothetical protein